MHLRTLLLSKVAEQRSESTRASSASSGPARNLSSDSLRVSQGSVDNKPRTLSRSFTDRLRSACSWDDRASSSRSGETVERDTFRSGSAFEEDLDDEIAVIQARLCRAEARHMVLFPPNGIADKRIIAAIWGWVCKSSRSTAGHLSNIGTMFEATSDASPVDHNACTADANSGEVDSAAMLSLPDVVTLIESAVSLSPTPFLSEKRGYTMIKSVSAKKGPRR